MFVVNEHLDRMGATDAVADYSGYPNTFSLTHNAQTWDGDPLQFLYDTAAVAANAGPAAMMAALAEG